MMDRNYPTSSFVDPLVPPAQTVAWAYDRSPSSIKPSSSYGATHLESELLQRQTYVSTHQLPTYTSTHHPTGLSGVFDSSSSTTETSIMNFLSAMESRSLQAGPACSMLPSFRPPSWSAGTNSSTTELYLTGALPSTATFPSPAALSAYQHVGASPSPATLSAYQHVGAFPPRCYTSTPSLTLQDPVFSTSSGLLPHHDPLLHLKPSQAALAFNHLPAPSPGSTLPIQSSTYRSAQESAPHLLQPQFSLLPQTLASAQPASAQPASAQPASLPYGSPVFSGSVERALQRECSVIKHHQRPSSGQAAPDQLPGSLQGYLGSGDGDVSYQKDPSRHTPGPSPPVEPAPPQGVNGTPQPKPDSASQTGLQQSQAYSSSSDPSPGYSSSSGGAKAKDCSSQMAPHPSDGGEGHPHSQSHAAGGSPESYPSPGQKQSSVTASQQSAGQLPSLLAISHSQSYPSSHSQTQVSFTSSEKLPSLYKTMPSFSDQAGSGLAVSQSLVYSSSQGQDAQYAAQAQALCLGSLSQAYTPSHSQGAPNVSYPSQSQGQDSSTQSYVAGQSLSSSYPQPRAQSLATTNSMQGYVLMQPSPVEKTDSSLTHPQKYLLPTPSPTFSATTHTQALQNDNRSSGPQDLKPAYGKQKLEELHIQELQALQQASLDASCPGSSNMAGPNNVVYVVSKMDDRYNTQSVIRSSLRSEEQMLGHLTPGHLTQGKDERLLSAHGQLGSRANTCGAPDPKTTNNPQILSSHVSLSAEELKQHSHLLRAPEPLQQSQQVLTSRAQADHSQARSQAAHTQFIRVPNTQVLLDPSQMILLQQPLIHPGHNPSKGVSAHVQQNQNHASSPGQVQYLHLNGEMIGHSGLNGSHQGAMDSTKHLPPKDPYGQAVSQQDNKFPLNSICFPESIMLADERNILSNVDDILAATAAACGVTPHDFVKATTDGDMADSKGHFQTVGPRHVSPEFSSSQHAIIANTSSSHAMTLNGTHVTSDGRPGHPSNGSDLHANGGVGVEEDYKLGYDPSGLGPGATGKTPARGPKAMKREEALVECSSEGFPRKRARPRTAGPGRPAGQEEEEAGGRPGKRGGGQAKRQNSRGSDTSSPSTSDGVYDGYQQHERIRQKIREVEEKQPEVKTGFIGSFLDFLKSGPKQHFSSTPARAASRSRKPSSKPPPCPQPPLPPKLQPPGAPVLPQDGHAGVSLQQKRLEEDLQRNLETLPSFSSDEEESVGRNQALQNSITSALSALDEPGDRRQRTDTRLSSSLLLKPDQTPSMPQPVAKAEVRQKESPREPSATALSGREGAREAPPPGLLAARLTSVAVEGQTDEDLSDSGGEGMYRERDEFVVRNEDIESLEVTLTAGREPPAIWKVQKALLQKFVPELRDGRRVFSATNSYLGYFGDAKTMYRRVYVKFLDTVNKRESVRVCNRKPRCKPLHSMRGAQVKTLLGLKPAPPSLTSDPAQPRPPVRPRPRQPRPRAEAPPKKRRRWKEELPLSDSSSEEPAEETDSQGSPGSRVLNTRTMKDTFISFLELLVSVAMDADVFSALERENVDLLLPQMRRVDSLISDSRKRLLPKLHMGELFKTALDSFPEISMVTELKDGEGPAFKVRLGGKAYNRKTMKPSKPPSTLPLEYTVDQKNTQWLSLYHSLQHYKYHTYLMCKDEIASLQVRAGALGQDQAVQLCMQNTAWVEVLFNRYGELLNQVQLACR